MTAYSLAQSVVSTYKPTEWSPMTTQKEVLLEELGSTSAEFRNVELKIRRSLPVSISRVVRVQNPYLYGCYLLKKEEYVNRYGTVTEKELFHATGTHNVSSIVQQNLNWRLSTRTKFGMGVSFSPDASYANQHCNRSNPLSRAMFVAKVLVHSTCLGSSYMMLPSVGSDTSTGNNGSVYVKYSDNEFYPTYVAYYTSPPIVFRRRRFFY
ncbi:protein mono-ADP-ribosyltransferase PARP12-like [Periplaneta americana]|uniref:protein mono-ADP-ribosyltransferase PARP12-like n=1 Tax=Periplaneta americana TaxID=6978 RepID=UPI0037E8039B